MMSMLFCKVEQEGSTLQVTAQCGGKTKLGRTMWGTIRGYLGNAVHGVSQGYRKDLELHGVGFRARVGGRAEKTARAPR